MKILVVDIETTGFYPSDAIVEIGISLVDTVTRKVILVFDEVIKESDCCELVSKKEEADILSVQNAFSVEQVSKEFFKNFW